MSPGEKRGRICCRAGLFHRQEARVSQLTEAINRAATAGEKAKAAEGIVEEVDVLLGCDEYDEGSVDCRLCRSLSGLRRQTGRLVVKAGRLDDGKDRAGADRR
jgi:hypothetical protein